MEIFMIFIGLIFLSLSLGYLGKHKLIIKLNEWGREYIFTDKWLLTHRRTTGILFLVFAVICLYISLMPK